MKVQMRTGISGGRGDGTPWPEVGGVIVVGDEEGRALCAVGHAIPYVEPEDGVEKRGAGSPAEAPAVTAPPVNAPKADWVAHAAAQGMSEDEAAAMTKADLIAAVG